MWNDQLHPQASAQQQLLQSNGQLLQHPGQPRLSKSAPCSPLKPLLANKRPPPARADSFHVIHKVPVGDTPYVKAKHVQLVDKDPNRAIALFWAAINAGDRVDSALKDMAIVMKQQNRPEEAIEAIKSLRYRCSDHAQESLDNVLLDLYKRCGRLDDQIALLKHKLHLIHQGLAFNGRRTKTARSQGKKFQVSIEQEATRLLGNLGWAYMQQSNFVAAEAVYRKALSIEPDNNKVCNLGICLMKQGRLREAKTMLKSVKPAFSDSPWGSDSHLKSFERAQQMLSEMEEGGTADFSSHGGVSGDEEPLISTNSSWRLWSNQNPLTDADFSGALFATAGFGPAQRPPLPPPVSQTAEAHTPQRSQSNRGARNAHGGRWAEEDEEQGFANENSNQEIQMELLRQKLEKLVMMNGDGKRNGREASRGGAINQRLERSNSADAPLLRPPRPLSSCSLSEMNGNGSVLNSSAPPFVAKSLPKPCTNVNAGEEAPNLCKQVSLTFDNANHQQHTAAMAKPSSLVASARPSQLLVPDKGSIGRKNCCKSLSFSVASESDQDAIAMDNNNSVSSPDAWSRLGFIQADASSPLCTIATVLRKRFSSSCNNATLLQDDCQRRLPVFVDMTLPANPAQATV
ncbi:hypothetical protein GOP47_0001634 [Adiantum capillus-veneris]|uniref:Protein POLLENLESS 3-LIKE 2 n=1 Tax=Adiantum capillus-veneris TaxID=13818 RepID=A0A9D4V9X6_ADICA|nr:hypothetical protein GOP47_0001634 [Adiantum capillus-veneris]